MLPTGFYLSIYEFLLPPDINGFNARRHFTLACFNAENFQRALVLNSFSTLSAKCKASKIYTSL